MNPETRAVLANALYFNAEWQSSFINGATKRKKFFPHGREHDTTIFVNLMANGGLFPHFYDIDTDSDVLGFPYKQNSSTMYVFLPRNSNKERLREVQGQLTAHKIDTIIDQMTLKTCVTLFPKMHLTSSHFLKPELKNLNLNSLFDPETSDLSLITQDENNRAKRSSVSYKTPASEGGKEEPLDFKDFLINKRIVKSNGSDKKRKRSRRDSEDDVDKLERLRAQNTESNPGLSADEVIHKVDLNINEKGTEGERNFDGKKMF